MVKQKSRLWGTKHIFFLVALLLFTITLVDAQPPAQTLQAFAEGYFIEIPEQGFLQADRDYTFHFHAFNISDGIEILNATAACQMDLYNHHSELIFTNHDLTFNDTIEAWEVLVRGGNFTELGAYDYLVHCNNTVLGGAVAVEFEVTADGRVREAFPHQFFVILLGLVFIILGLAKERYKMFKSIGSLMFMVMGLITLFPGYGFINWTTLLGKVLGFSLIALGFYFLIEDGFGRGTEQEERYSQEDEDEERFV